MQLLHLMPVFGSSGCRQLTDEVQARLALSFANCFLIRSGLRSYNCDKDTPVSECLKDVDSNAFTAYSNFFTVIVKNISRQFDLCHPSDSHCESKLVKDDLASNKEFEVKAIVLVMADSRCLFFGKRERLGAT